MRAVLLALCTLLIVGGASAAGDRIYRWTGADGKIYYGDQPPSGARDLRNLDRKVGTTPAVAESSSMTSEQVAALDKECASKRAQLSTYKNASRLVERDSLGREREFTAAEREQLMARVQSDLETQCGDAPQE